MNLAGFDLANGQLQAADFDLNGITQRGSAYDPDATARGHTEGQQTSHKGLRSGDSFHQRGLVEGELGQI